MILCRCKVIIKYIQSLALGHIGLCFTVGGVIRKHYIPFIPVNSQKINKSSSISENTITNKNQNFGHMHTIDMGKNSWQSENFLAFTVGGVICNNYISIMERAYGMIDEQIDKQG